MFLSILINNGGQTIWKSNNLLFSKISPKYLTNLKTIDYQQRWIYLKNRDDAFSASKVIKSSGKNYHQRYVNYAPLLYEWSQRINSGKLSMDTLLSSQQFRRVSENICDTIRHSDTNILNMIKSVIIMNLDPNLRIVRFLEDELIYKIEFNYDFRLLITSLNLYHRIKDTTPKRKTIFDTLIRTINDRLDNSKPTILDLVHLIKFSRHLTPEIMIKIEDQLTRYLDSEEEIPLDNLCYLLVLLSRHNRRNKTLIRSVVAKLLKYRSEEIYSMPPHMIHMISSLKRLNFPEINLLEKCSDILINFKFLENLNESSKRDFTVAISNFNFSYPKLNDYYLQTLMDKPDCFKHQDLITLTLMLSRLNYQREDLLDIIMNHIIPRCSLENCASKYQWLNFVNSLLILRCATLDHVKLIMKKSFYSEIEQQELENHFIKSGDGQIESNAETLDSEEQEKTFESQENLDTTPGREVYQMMNIRRKYCLIKGMLYLQSDTRLIDPKTHQPMGKIPFEKFFESQEELESFENYLKTFDYEMFKRSKDVQGFKKKLLLSFESFAPSKDFYMANDVKTPFGFSIDAELKVDDEGKPQIIQDPGILFKNDCKPEEPFKRVALMCIGFNETILDDNSRLIGPKETELSLLRSLGYVTIPVHQNSLPQSVTSLNRIKFLQNLIASHVRNDDGDKD